MILSSAPGATPDRIPGLDAARAFAVIAMVIGHTADALLSDVARAAPWVQTYWTFRGLTAPLFLFVSGWAVMALVSRSQATGWALIRERLGRVLLLIGLGLLLRFPGWNLPGFFAGEESVWRHVCGFDALQCIGVSLFIGVCVMAATPSRRVRAAVLGALVVLVPLVSGWIAANGSIGPIFFQSALVSDRYSPFPLFPWMAYFFAGALTGQLLPLLGRQWVQMVGLVVVGAVLIFAASLAGTDNLPRWSGVLFTSRLGQVLLIASLAMALPVALTRRLSPIGRSSLVVYVAHIPVVYGWSTIAGLNARIGRTLNPAEVLVLAGLLLTGGVLMAQAIRRIKGTVLAPAPAVTPAAETPATGESRPS